MLEALKIDQCFHGWKHVINDMALNNELADVRAINIPNLKSNIVERQDWYTFADFLPPGYHQILIYDPLLERAFTKDFVIKLNQRDFIYPEYPLPQTENSGKLVQDMWRNWIGYAKQVLDQIQKAEFHSAYQSLDKFMKDKKDLKLCMQVLRSHL